MLITAFCITAATTAALGFTVSSFWQLAVVIALSGCFAGASQAGVIALTAVTYPVAVRSTGVGWAFAAGRLGAVVGPLLGGVMLLGLAHRSYSYGGGSAGADRRGRHGAVAAP